MKMEKNPRMKWEIGNTMRITKSETPFEGAQLNLNLSRENMHADQIQQDVLFFSGQDDHFIPIRLHDQQVKALINAKSVMERIFTEIEHAQNHCQIGNCWGNAPMKNFFGHLKEEAIRRVKNPTFQQAQQIIDDYIYFYNNERIQLKKKQTPYQLRCLSG